MKPKSLVIVESPAKARTIERYLGGEYTVLASVGHIKDLPKKRLGVDPAHGFKTDYEIIPGKEAIVKNLRKAADKADVIYLAADPDREGEAICQHIFEEIEAANDKVFRVMFNEITRDAIRQAFQSPGRIDENLVKSQNTRRILDRLVGYKISPLLWRKVRRGLSAGRVQTVALRLIVDREREIGAFQKEEYWVFTAQLEAALPPPFRAKAIKLDGQKFVVRTADEARALRGELEAGAFVVESVRATTRKQHPQPPFTTSKLQQEANRRFKLPAAKTMQIAQRLYEGIDLGDGSVGLITYMRTDSTRVAPSALETIRSFIQDTYGNEYLPEKPRSFSKADLAQEAPEAIRPTDIARTPASVRTHLKADEYKIYTLIWQRCVASQMEPALFRHTDIKIAAGRCLFQATGDVPQFAGFLKVYQESADEDVAESDPANPNLPPVEAGQVLRLQQLQTEQQFTQPPPRYTEATLIKALEEKGIGRPSTYAQIVTVIQNRQYVIKEDGRFRSTETGEIVIDLLTRSFPDLFDYNYTATMEQSLDLIEAGKQNWLVELQRFYGAFDGTLQKAEAEMSNLKREKIPTDERCPNCGAGMVIRWGRFGKFMACERYPECRTSKPVTNGNGNGDAATAPTAKAPARVLDEQCPDCGKPLVERSGRFGKFIACSGYPKCHYKKKPGINMPCPQPGCSGEIVMLKNKRGRIFYGCSKYPACTFTSWQRPVPRACPACGNAYMVQKQTKKDGPFQECPRPECRHRVPGEANGSGAPPDGNS